MDFGTIAAQIVQTVTTIEYGNLACQGTEVGLSCPRGYKIYVTDAFYGRRDSTSCSDPKFNNNQTVNINVRCNALDVKASLAATCDGRTT